MKSDDEKNIHEGHRQRLLDLAISAGVDNMSEVQVMELFLTYIFPRGDVNPLAHVSWISLRLSHKSLMQISTI